MKYYIAENLHAFQHYIEQNNIALHEAYYIKSGDVSAISGLRIHPSNLEIIGDPNGCWSFWHRLIYNTTIVE